MSEDLNKKKKVLNFSDLIKVRMKGEGVIIKRSEKDKKILEEK